MTAPVTHKHVHSDRGTACGEPATFSMLARDWLLVDCPKCLAVKQTLEKALKESEESDR